MYKYTNNNVYKSMLKPWCVDVLTMVCEQHVWYIHWFILLILSHRTLYDAQFAVQSDLMIYALIILMTWCMPWCDDILLCTMMCTCYIHITCWWWLHILDDDSTYWMMMVHTWWLWCTPMMMQAEKNYLILYDNVYKDVREQCVAVTYTGIIWQWSECRGYQQ